MLTMRLLRKYLRHVTVMTASLCLILYIAFHALQGERTKCWNKTITKNK